MPKVKVDWVKCNGCGTRADNCPASVFDLQNLQDYQDSKKSVDCILCMTCVAGCPTGAITVEEGLTHSNLGNYAL